MRIRPTGHSISLITMVLAGTLMMGPAVQGAGLQVRLRDLNGQLVDPFHRTAEVTVTVLLFVSVECPISNRYAPEIRRLYDAFASRGVQFWLVYPNPLDSPDNIRQHLHEFGYQARALQDPDHELVKRTGATITPEAALYDRFGRLVYRGRVDDRHVTLGLERPAPTRLDLYEALLATLEGRSILETTTPAVGCFIADFVHHK